MSHLETLPSPASRGQRVLASMQHVIEWLSDRANPILVRHVRQELRNRSFFAIFALLLLISCFASVLVAANARDPSGREGMYLFSVLGATLSFALWVVQAAGAYRSMIRERDDDTWDLIDLTGMSPGTILRGTIYANLVQGVLYTSATAPFMVMAYLLRGIDLYTIIMVLLFVQVGGVVITSFSVFWGCLGPNKSSRALLGGFLFIAALTMWGSCLGLWAELDEASSELARSMSRNPAEVWTAILITANASIAFIALCLVFSAALLTFRANNRSTGPRLVWLFIWFNALVWVFAGIAYHEGFFSREILMALSFMSPFSAGWILVYGAFAVSEDYVLSPRQARWIADATGWRRWCSWAVGPGAARGRMGYVCMVGAVIAMSLIPLFFLGEHHSTDDCMVAILASWLMLAYGSALLVVGDFFYRWVFTNVFPTTAARRSFLLLLLAITSIVSPIITAVTDISFVLEYLSPMVGIFRSLEHFSPDTLAAFVDELDTGVPFILLVGFVAVVVLYVQAMRNWRLITERVHALEGDRNPRGGN